MARIFKPQSARRTSAESTPTQLLIEGFSHDGRGIARHQGKTVFVEGALPSETVEVAHYRRQKRFSECRSKNVVTASPERVQPSCGVFHRCGGCQLQHLQADKQIEYKQQALLQMLLRQYQLQPKQLLEPIRSNSEGYRTRVRFGIDAKGQLSFRQKASDDLVAITACPVIAPNLQRLLPQVQAWLNQLPERSGITHIEMIDAADDHGEPLSALVIRHIKPLSVAQREVLQLQLTGTICWFQAQKGGPLSNATDEPVAPYLYLSLPNEGIQLKFSPGDFTQVNAAVNEKMVAQAIEWLQLESGDCVADLFCGMGNFTLPIAKRVAKTLGIEGSDLMVERASQNAAANELTEVEFKALDLTSTELGMLLVREKINKILIDPPRSGAKFVCEQIADSDIKKLVYVSCNPASLARDASILAGAGFELSALRSMDMFPHTSHMEAMALFVRG
ncbi:MAG: 23S rRNA (uracil(1939)-C(5))-methyltransferase RlmD [Cellvibrionaceae bacterium]